MIIPFQDVLKKNNLYNNNIVKNKCLLLIIVAPTISNPTPQLTNYGVFQKKCYRVCKTCAREK